MGIVHMPFVDRWIKRTVVRREILEQYRGSSVQVRATLEMEAVAANKEFVLPQDARENRGNVLGLSLA